MNKEYTYPQICKKVGWEEKAGNSKKAHIKEIESAFEYYHPINKKTHKEKKSYIFTKQLRELVEPSKSNCGGSHNTKNIKPMIEFMQSVLSDDICNGNYHSITAWLCDFLELLDKDLCATVYGTDNDITAYCEKNGIQNKKLLVEYVSEARRTLKKIFLKALENMEKSDLCEFFKGYIFIYQMSKRMGFFGTHILNDLIIANEISVCNEMNQEHHLSEKMKGRQLLMQIYNRKNLTEEFNDLKIVELMGDEEAIKQLNKVMECEYGCSYTPIDAEHPLINYYFGISVPDMEFADVDAEKQKILRKEICIIVREKTRKAILSKGNKNQFTDEKYFVYNESEHGVEMERIADLLFVPFKNVSDNLSDEEAELDELFGRFEVENDSDLKEIFDMPTVNFDIETDKVGLDGDDILPWMVISNIQYEDNKIVFSREEAEEMFV